MPEKLRQKNKNLHPCYTKTWYRSKLFVLLMSSIVPLVVSSSFRCRRFCYCWPGPRRWPGADGDGVGAAPRCPLNIPGVAQ